jgi:hypothetical protein
MARRRLSLGLYDGSEAVASLGLYDVEGLRRRLASMLRRLASKACVEGLRRRLASKACVTGVLRVEGLRRRLASKACVEGLCQWCPPRRGLASMRRRLVSVVSSASKACVDASKACVSGFLRAVKPSNSLKPPWCHHRKPPLSRHCNPPQAHRSSYCL